MFANGYIGPKTYGTQFKQIVCKADKAQILLQLWNFFHVHAYTRPTAKFYEKTNLLVLVYDLTKYVSTSKLILFSKNSLVEAIEYLKEARMYVPENELLVTLIGNKVDLSSKREVCAKESHSVAETNRVHLHFEVSALDYSQVRHVMNTSVHAAWYLSQYKLPFDYIRRKFSNKSTLLDKLTHQDITLADIVIITDQ
jgi:GTPase SAR1 family protein